MSQRDTTETFFQIVKLTKASVQKPIFEVDGINFIFIKKNNLFFVFTARENVSPSYVIEILLSIIKEIKDFCGVLNEEMIRKNFVLVYEIIEEMIDFGYPQSLSTEQIKPCIASEPLTTEDTRIIPKWLKNQLENTYLKAPKWITDNRLTNKVVEFTPQ